MGGSIARKLLSEGQQVVVCDVQAEAVKASGAKLVAGTPSELVAELATKYSDSPGSSGSPGSIVIVVVRNDDEVREVVCGEKGILAGVSKSWIHNKQAGEQAKPVVLIHSTVQPETVKDVAQICAKEGITVLDAPVTGGAGATENGDLVVMLGGDEKVCAEVAPKLSHYAGKVVRVGALGAGQKAKIARNLITYSEWIVAAEATALAEAAEVDVEQLWEIIDHSDRHIGTHGGYSGVRRLLPAPEMMQPLAELARKDLSLAAELARKVDHNSWLAERAIDNIAQTLKLEQ